MTILESGHGSEDTFADGTIDSDDVGYADSDGDGIPDQLDDDVDGFGDAGDLGTSNDPSDPTNPNSGGTGVVADSGTDTDGDGIADSVDETVVHFGSPVDSDGDGIYDNVDTDDDDDGIPDYEEINCAVSPEAIPFTVGSGTVNAPINDAMVTINSSTTLLDVAISSGTFQANEVGTIRMEGSNGVINTATLTFDKEVSLVLGGHVTSIGGNFDSGDRWRIYAIGETFTVDDPNDDLTDPNTGAIIVDGIMTDTVDFYRNASGTGSNLDWTITSTPAKVFYLEYIAQTGTNAGQVKASVKCLNMLNDTDGDGIPDRLESNIIDTDGDGNIDYNDNNADGEAGTDGTGGEENGLVYGHWNDADSDGIPDHLDADDGDGSGTDITGSGDSDADVFQMQ